MRLIWSATWHDAVLGLRNHLMERRLRDFVIASDRLSEFVELWDSAVRPLREHFGFIIEGAWRVPAENRFLWIIGFNGDFVAADRDYYDSPERAALNPDPADLIVDATEIVIEPI